MNIHRRQASWHEVDAYQSLGIHMTFIARLFVRIARKLY